MPDLIPRGWQDICPWTIPISFPVDKALASSLKAGEMVNSKNDVVGTLKISDIFPFEKQRYLQSVYATERTDHPGGHMVLDDPRDMLLGGVLPGPRIMRPESMRASGS